MDAAARQVEAEKESKAMMLAEKVMFAEIKEKEEQMKPMMRVVAYDDDDSKKRTKQDKARLEALKKMAGM